MVHGLFEPAWLEYHACPENRHATLRRVCVTLFTTVSDMFPKYAVASVIGMGGLAGALGGMYFPIYCGKMLDQFKEAGNITAGYAILFAICAFAYLVAFAIHHLLVPSLERVRLDK